MRSELQSRAVRSSAIILGWLLCTLACVLGVSAAWVVYVVASERSDSSPGRLMLLASALVASGALSAAIGIVLFRWARRSQHSRTDRGSRF